jgi:hypothetical protein
VIQIVIDEEDEMNWVVYLVKTDYSAVTLTKCGKNLFSNFTVTNPSLNLSAGGVTAAIKEGEPYVTLNGTATGSNGKNAFQYTQDPILLKKGVTYVVSKKVISGSNAQVSLFVCDVTNPSKYFNGNIGAFTPQEDVSVFIGIHAFAGNTYENQKMVVQLEVGKVASEYEEYKGEQYTPNTDGTVEGVTSLYPTTTLMTDTEGVTIEAEYIKNVNEALGVEPSDDAASSLVVGANIADVLRYTKQDLTDAQKAQIIENLGLADYIQSMIQNYLDTTIASE